jgi:hypothetical protein
MKDLWKNGVVVLLIMAGLYIIFLRECKHPTVYPAKDEIIIKKSVWDSIVSIGNLPPKITHDTVYVKGRTVYVAMPTYVVDKKDTTIKDYSDSIKNDEINVNIAFKLRGDLIYWNMSYTPIVKQVITDKTVYVPKIVDREVPVPKNGLFGYAIVGGNGNRFIPGIGLDFITKKNTIVGIQYQRLGSENLFGVRLGMKIL